MLTRLTDGRLIQVRCFQEISALEKIGKKADALERGQGVHDFLNASSTELQSEIDKFQARVQQELPKLDNYGADCKRELQLLRSKQEELRLHLEGLKAAIADDNDPKVQEKKKKIRDLVRAAELLVTQAEYDAALAKYAEVLREVNDDAAARQKIEMTIQNLKNAWALKPGDKAHAQARQFIVQQWPKLGALPDVRDQLPNVRRSFERCKAVGDKLSLSKMQLAAVEVITRFADELKKLADMATEEEDKKTVEQYVKVNEDLQKLLSDVEQYLQGNAK